MSMKKFFGVLAVAAGMCLFLTGCFTAMTWEDTGTCTYKIEKSAVKVSEKEVSVIQYGTLYKKYIPFLDCLAVEEPYERTLTFERGKVISKYQAADFLLQPDEKAPPAITKKAYGLPYLENVLCSADNAVTRMREKDIQRLSKTPFFIPYYGSSTHEYTLVSPVSLKKLSDGNYRLKATWLGDPETPWQPMFPYQFNNNQYSEDMTGFWPTCLRVAMCPVPVVLDVATFPLQLGCMAIFAIYGHAGPPLH